MCLRVSERDGGVFDRNVMHACEREREPPSSTAHFSLSARESILLKLMLSSAMQLHHENKQAADWSAVPLTSPGVHLIVLTTRVLMNLSATSLEHL